MWFSKPFLTAFFAVAVALSSQQSSFADVTAHTYASENATVTGTAYYYTSGIIDSYEETRTVGYEYDPVTGSYTEITETYTVNIYGPVLAGTATRTASAITHTEYYDPDGPGPIIGQSYTVYEGHVATFPSPLPGDWMGGITWNVVY